MRCDLRGRGRGEGACEGEGARRMVMAMAMARAHARTRARAGAHASMRGRERMRGRGHRRGCIIYTWRGARARWRGRRRGPVHGRGALQARDELRASTQRNCMQARSARERRGGGMPSAREGKQADANDRRASGSSIETRKPATRRTFSETSKQRGHVHALLIFLLSTRVHEDCQSTPLSISGGKYQLRQKYCTMTRMALSVAQGRRCTTYILCNHGGGASGDGASLSRRSTCG